MNAIVGNWTVGYTRFFANQRTTALFSGADPANVGRFFGRPDVLDGCDPNDHQFTNPPAPNATYVRWNVNCVAVPANGRYGTATRGNLKLANFTEDSINAFKSFYLTDDESGPYFRLQFRLLHPFRCPCRNANDGPQSTNISSPSFGRYISASQRARNLVWVRLALGF